ncbi:MAG: DUF1015 domain-containing protein [Acholeplasmataceae bacterium]|jgi:uncharacterized protein (DUF1015 family)|nr:DUF1015 domain-containing protein [Acholeplasmataceae bacterium]
MLPKKNPITVPRILLPNDNIDLSKWAVVACDQYTSQPSYWQKLKQYVDSAPSTLNMILPEAHLEKMTDETILKINHCMEDYLNHDIFKSIGESFILVERTTSKQKKRLGLIMNIDLECYDYKEGTKPLIRTTEKTILSRIPPRVRIRKNALLEFSHVMLLVDDPHKDIIEGLYQQKDTLTKLYDFDLNMMGGHIVGYQVKNTIKVIESFEKLIENQKDPILFIAGDGNHSLATAKAHWEDVKKKLTKKERETHPARYTLVEVVNIYDDGLDFEGIHRVLFNTSPDFLTGLFHQVDKEVESWAYTTETDKLPIFIPKSTAIAYEQIQRYIDDYMKNHPEVTIDFIHGDEELIEVCQNHPKSIGIRMPALAESDLFPFIKLGKVMPRKSFSIGCATAKRYYLESQIIK